MALAGTQLEADSEPSPDDLASLADLAKLAGFMPYLASQIASLEKRLEARVFKAIQDGTLTPETALNLWIEKKNYHDLLKGFQTKVKLGIAASDRISDPTKGAR